MLTVRRGLATLGAAVAVATIYATTVSAHNVTGFHWADEGRARAFVTFVDKTNASWPIVTTTNEWDFAGNINIYYGYRDCGGQGHCVSVDTSLVGPFADRRCGEVRGLTRVEVVSPGSTHMSSDTSVTFNERCQNSGFSNADRRTIACHEEGHVIGLAHADNSLLTCMGAPPGETAWMNRSGTPRQHDFLMLDDEIYDHND